MKVLLTAIALLTLLAVACGDDDGNGVANGDGNGVSTGPCDPPSSEAPDVSGETFTTENGVEVTIVARGPEEDPASSGDALAVHYAGWLQDGPLFDTSLDEDCEPFIFQLGVGRAIPGWDEGLVGMSPSEVRRLVIPPELAYGDQGSGDAIPPGATLVFDVELVAFGRAAAPDATP